MNQIVNSDQIESSFIYISKSGDGNFSNIQDGIDAANPGDTIYVFNGTYFENVVIDKSIILTGENKISTIIDGRNTGNVIKINANNVTIQDFTIQHSGLIYPNSGINLSSNNNRVINNLIMNNYYGMTLYNSSGNIIQANTIQNDDHCGIYLSSSLKNFIVNNTIKFHNYNGIGLYYSSNNNNIETNNLNNNGFCGVNIRTSLGNMVIGNNISNNSIGIHLPLQNNEKNNSFSDNDINVDREFKFDDFGIFIIVGFYGLTSIVIIIIYEKIQRRKRK
jgi:parallel beta-helix repeat protein